MRVPAQLRGEGLGEQVVSRCAVEDVFRRLAARSQCLLGSRARGSPERQHHKARRRERCERKAPYPPASPRDHRGDRISARRGLSTSDAPPRRFSGRPPLSMQSDSCFSSKRLLAPRPRTAPVRLVAGLLIVGLVAGARLLHISAHSDLCIGSLDRRHRRRGTRPTRCSIAREADRRPPRPT